MEVSPLFIYFVGISDNVCNLFVAAALMAALSLLIGGWIVGCGFDNHDDETKGAGFKTIKIGAICLILCVIACVFMPSSKTLIAMKVVPAVANAQVIQKIPKALEKFIDAYIGEKTTTDVLFSRIHESEPARYTEGMAPGAMIDTKPLDAITTRADSGYLNE